MTETETAIHLFFRAIDTHDWDAVRRGLAEQVQTDYTSLWGGSPETMSAEELITSWRALVPGFDVTQHFVGPLVATAEDRVEANVRGYHHLDGQTWMAAGWYVLRVDPTHRITGITLTMSYEHGDRALTDRARERAAG